MQPIPLSRPMTPELARAVYAGKRFNMTDKLSNFKISPEDADLIHRMSDQGSDFGKPTLRAGPAMPRPIPVNRPVTDLLARSIYACLMLGCDAPMDRQQIDLFARYMMEDDVLEWRFMGSLGQGGKFSLNSDGICISCYPEDETPERLAAIERTMRGLRVLMEGK